MFAIRGVSCPEGVPKPDLQAPVILDCKMNPEKRMSKVRNGIDVRPH